MESVGYTINSVSVAAPPVSTVSYYKHDFVQITLKMEFQEFDMWRDYLSLINVIQDHSNQPNRSNPPITNPPATNQSNELTNEQRTQARQFQMMLWEFIQGSRRKN